jgi:hypothetical protein
VEPALAEITQQRIQDAQKYLDSNEDLKALIKKRSSFWNEINRYHDIIIVHKIQPLWTSRNNLAETDAEELALLILRYRLLGLDPEYFTNGAGSSDGNGEPGCTIL